MNAFDVPETEARIDEIFQDLCQQYGLMMRLSDISALMHIEEASTRVAIFKKADGPVWRALAKSALRIGKRIEWCTRDVARAIVAGQQVVDEPGPGAPHKPSRKTRHRPS